jgi:parallel beta-helix repeat protein
MKAIINTLMLLGLMVLVACGGGGGSDGDSNNVSYTLGGTVSGLTGTGLVLQNNGASDLPIDTNGPFVFPTAFAEGSTYVVTVFQQPTGQKCLVERGTGYLFSNIMDVAVNCSAISSTVTPWYPQNGSEWNDYVENDGATRLSATDQVCDATVGNCLHGGEMRVWRSGQAISCAGLVVSDALNAFDWTCDASGGTAVFISTGLKDGKRLSDLIDFDQLVWRDNQVIVSGAATLSSPSGKWWAVPIEAANSGGSLRSRRIYIVTTNPHATYALDADKVALVVRPGIVLQGPGGGGPVVTSNSWLGPGVKHLWFEGTVDGAAASEGIKLFGSLASVLRGVDIRNAQTGLVLNITANNLLSDLRIHSNSGAGIYLGGVPNNSFTDVVVTNNGGDGIFIGNSPNSFLSNVLAANNGGNGVNLDPVSDARLERVVSVGNGQAGVRVWYSKSTLLSGITAVNNGGDGILLTASDSSTLQAVVSANNGGVGISIGGTYSVVNAAAVSNGGVGVRLNFPSTVYFSGVLKVGGNGGGDCWAGSGTTGLLTNCNNSGASDATLTTGVNVNTSFAGKITVDDPQNSSDNNGTALYENISDWTHFANTMRGWGDDGNVFPDASNRGLCVSGATCRIWDWSLASSDSVAREVLALPTGNDVLTHRWSPTSELACQTIPGAVWDVAMSSCTSTFLRHAVEIIDDDIGNDNGLCESGEACLYTPNLGAYQGHGDLQSAGMFVNGTLSNITLWRYTSNGR